MYDRTIIIVQTIGEETSEFAITVGKLTLGVNVKFIHFCLSYGWTD